jgi:hypothetical protein
VEKDTISIQLDWLYINADETEDKKLFVNFLRNNGFGKIFNRKNKQWEEFDLQSDEFPLTRVLDFKTSNPLGWIKLIIKRKKKYE